MTSQIETIGEPSLSALVFAALDNPATVDLAALTRRADEFLAAAQGGCPDLLYSARAMAGAAFELGVFATPEAHAQLAASAQAFTMMLALHRHHQQ